MDKRNKILPSELAQVLFDVFIEDSKFDQIADLSLDEAQAERFHSKMRFYRIALTLKILSIEEKTDAGFYAVRLSLEARTLPLTQSASVPYVTALRVAMEDLANLISSKNAGQSILWAQNWFNDIGINESNPIICFLLSLKWMDAFPVVTKMLREWQPTSTV